MKKIPAYPEIRYAETFNTIGSDSYNAALERIRTAVVRINALTPQALEDNKVLDKAFRTYEAALDDVEAMQSFLRLKTAEDDASYQPAEAGEIVGETAQRLLISSAPLVARLEYLVQKGECPPELERIRHAVGLLHHSWMRKLDLNMLKFIQQMRVTGFWPLVNFYERLLKHINVEITTEENLKRRLSFAQCMVSFRSNTSRDVRKQIYDGLNRQLAVLSSNFADIFNTIQGMRLLYWKEGGADFRRMPFEHANVSMEAWSAMRRVMLRRVDEIRETVRRRAHYFGTRGMRPFDLIAGPPVAGSRRITATQALNLAMMSATFVGEPFSDFVKKLIEEDGIEMRPTSSRSGESFTVPMGSFKTVRVVSPFANDMDTTLLLANMLGEGYARHVLEKKPRFERQLSPLVLSMAGHFHETMARRAWLELAGAEAEPLVKWHAWRTTASSLLSNAVRTDFELAFIEARQTSMVSVKNIKTLIADAWERWYGDVVEDPDLSLWMTQRHFFDTYRFMPAPAFSMGFLLSQWLVHFYRVNPKTFPKDYKAMLEDAGSMDVDVLFAKHMHIDLKDEAVWEQALDECLSSLKEKSAKSKYAF